MLISGLYVRCRDLVFFVNWFVYGSYTFSCGVEQFGIVLLLISKRNLIKISVKMHGDNFYQLLVTHMFLTNSIANESLYSVSKFSISK